MLLKLVFKSKQQLSNNEDSFKNVKGVIAGGLSGLTTAIITHPLETIQVNQQVEKSTKKTKSLKALYKGFPVRAVRSVISMGVGFGAYNAYMRALDKKWTKTTL